jgi:6-phosphogluconolactonase
MRSRLASAVLVFLLVLTALARAGVAPVSVYVGTYTGGKSKGIYRFQLDLSSGKATSPELAAETKSPSFLAIHPGGKLLYSANEASPGVASAFSIDAGSGKLTFLNEEPTQGSGPCHLVVDRGGKYVLLANYGSGSLSVFPIQADGRLGALRTRIAHQGSSINPERQKEPHAHSINLDPKNRFAVAADLGLDKLMVYRFAPDQGEVLVNRREVPVTPGSGPRHFAFHPDGPFAYVINELSCTVTAFRYDGEKGDLKELQSLSTLPGKLERGFSTAEVVVHPSGKFLYGSNRGHDSIAIFAIDRESGMLKPAGHEPTRGKTPRNFAIEPSGKYLLAENQDSDTIVVFRVDPESGRLSATGEVINVPSPVCVKFLAAP